MADFLIRNSNIGISVQPEASLSTIKTDAAEYIGAVTNALNVQIPNVEKLLDSGLIGDGDEWAQQANPDYAAHTGMTFSDRLNTSQFALLAARALSGTITSTEVEVGDGVYDHVIEMKAGNLDPQLKSSSIAFEMAGFDFILGGMVANTLSVSMQGGSAPTYQCETVGTGYYEFMSAQTPALVLPAATKQNYVGQSSQSFIEFDDGTVFDLSSLGRLDTLNMQFSNALVTGERRIGDSLVNSADPNSGAFVKQLTRGDQRTLTLSMGVYVDNDKRGYMAHINNIDVTNITSKSVGNVPIGVAQDKFHEVEVIVPKATVVSPSLGGDRKGIVTLNFEPLFDPTSGEDGIFKIRIRNEDATLA